MATSPLFLARNRGEQTIFVPAFADRPRAIYTPDATNGSQVKGINVASTDASGTINVQFGLGQILTTSGNMGTGTFVDGGGGDDTIVRTSGSFLVDGWRVGQRLVAQNALTLANDFEILLTGVAATVLTFATATVGAGENFDTTTYLARVTRSWAVDVVAGSGIAAAAAVSGMEPANAPFIDGSPNRLLELGPLDILFAKLDATLLTGETIDISVIGGDY